LRSTSWASGGVASFLSAGKLSAVSMRAYEHIWSPSSMPQRPSQACVQDRRGWHREPSLSSGDPEIEDGWLLIHQATDPKRPSLTSFSRKGDREKALNSLSGLERSQPS
jgi:hypothetical protein